ncbi:MAG: SHOCT domain-containing protein [Oscillospiraceae bacterium]|nr:SHOCT domain-containing protein [Oscillospiraceae bacterium]
MYELPYEDDPDPDVIAKQKKEEKETEEKKIAAISENLIADELRKLKELLDEGVLTKEEFDEQKKKLLKK